MPRLSIGGSSSSRSWQDEDKFTAAFQGLRSEKINGDDAGIVVFVDEKGEVIERWATKLWERLINGEPADRKTGRPAQKPAIKTGDVLYIESGDEKKLKGGKRFRQFKVELLTGKDIPKSLR